MADVKGSDLPAALDADLTPTDVVVGVDMDPVTKLTKRFTLAQIRTAIFAAAGSGWNQATDVIRTLQRQAGSSTKNAQAGGSIFEKFSDTSTSGTGETDIVTHTLPASLLATDGDRVECVYGGSMTAGGANRVWKLYFGGTSVGANLYQGASASWTRWMARVTIIRVSASVVRIVFHFSIGGSAFAHQTLCEEITGLTLANANIVKITGSEDNGAQPITCKMATLNYFPASV